jgi:hypothetical protein
MAAALATRPAKYAMPVAAVESTAQARARVTGVASWYEKTTPSGVSIWIAD